MANDIIAQSTANVNTQQRKIFEWPYFHVKQDNPTFFTTRFLEAWHRLDLKKGRRVKQIRLAEMLAERMGGTLSPNTVKGWESGAIPDLETVGIIAELCGVHPSWLAFGLGTADDTLQGVVSVRPAKAPVAPTRAGMHASARKRQVRDKTPARTSSTRKAATKKAG